MKKSNTEWIEIIRNNEEKIIKKGVEMYRDALEHNHLRYVLYIDADGDLSVLQDLAGGNSFYCGVLDGSMYQLFSLDFQCYSPEITDDNFILKLKEKGYSEEKIDALQEEARENYVSLEESLKYHDELRNLVDECLQDVIDFEVENYARECVEEKYIQEIEYLELWEQAE